MWGLILRPTHILLPVALAAALLATGSADAGPIYNNGGPDHVVLQLADTTYAYSQVAEEFTLASGSNTIGGVNWWGGCNTFNGVS
jgi:hypothetical protein